MQFSKLSKFFVLSAFLLSIVSNGQLFAAPNTSTPDKVRSSVTFDMEYHRGGRHSRPENTLYSYLFAIEQGATIECDMQLTKEGKLILSHNPYLDPALTRDEQGQYLAKPQDMRNMKLEEIRKYNVGAVKPDTKYYDQHGKYQKVPTSAQIPTIDELFSLVKKCGRPIKISLEAKIYHDVEADKRAVIEADPVLFAKLFNEKVKEYGLEEQVIFQSFDWAVLVEMKKINPKIFTLANFSQQPAWGRSDEYLRPYEAKPSPYLAGLKIDDFKGDAVKAAHSLGIDAVAPCYKEITFDMVEEAHRFGMKIIAWNTNTLEQMEAMYSMGVDGLISDNGPLLREFLLKKGEKLLPVKEFKDSPYHLE